MGEYVYRAQDEYKNGEPIKCKKPESEICLQDHIGIASKKKSNGSRFISTTGRIGVAKYKYSGEKRSPIILIDLGALKEDKPGSVGEIFDFRDDETIKKLTKWTNYVRADREVTVENFIPAEYCRKIPPLIIDILAGLDRLVNDSNSGTWSIVADHLIDYINSQIMKCENTKNENIGNTKDVNVKIKKTFEMILGITLDDEDFIKYEENFIKSKINELEKAFIAEYYSDEMPKMEDVAKKLFGENNKNKIKCCQCIKAEILKKLSSFLITGIYLIERENIGNKINSEDEMLKIQNGILQGKKSFIYPEVYDPKGTKIQAQGKPGKNPNLYYINDYMGIEYKGNELFVIDPKEDDRNYITYRQDENGHITAAKARPREIMKNKSGDLVSYCSDDILLTEEEIKMALSYEECSNTLNVTEIGEKSLIGLEPDSIATVNRRENAQINHEVSIDAQGVEQGEKTENKPREGSEDGPGL